MAPPTKTPKRQLAEALSEFLDKAERLAGRRFYEIHLEAAARRQRRGMSIVDVEAGGRCIRLRIPSGKALWRAETFLTKEPATIEWINGFHHGDIFWDIGANLGIYSLYAAIVKDVVTLAFEPAAFNYALLCDNVRLNDLGNRILGYGIAFSARTELGCLRLPDDEPGVAFASLDESRAGLLEQAVLALSIDDFVELFSPPFPTHIKIDVDGFEEQILKGACRVLIDTRLKSLSVEVDEDAPERPQRIDAALANCGFRLVRAEVSPLTPDSPARIRQYTRS